MCLSHKDPITACWSLRTFATQSCPTFSSTQPKNSLCWTSKSGQPLPSQALPALLSTSAPACRNWVTIKCWICRSRIPKQDSLSFMGQQTNPPGWREAEAALTCPACGNGGRVTDSRRETDAGPRRRRRECCGYRWTTYEVSKLTYKHSGSQAASRAARRLREAWTQQERALSTLRSWLDLTARLLESGRSAQAEEVEEPKPSSVSGDEPRPTGENR